MGYIEVYNYTTQQKEQLECGLVTQQDVNAITSGTYPYEGEKSLSVTVSTASGHTQITCNTNWAFDLTDLDAILNGALGIRCSGVYHSNYTRYRTLDVNERTRFGFNEDYTSRPYIEFERTQSGSGDRIFNAYGCWFWVTASGGANINRGVQSSAYYAYRCCMCPVFMDTSFIQANGTLGVIQAETHEQNNNGVIIITYYQANFVTDDYDYNAGETGFTPTSAPTQASNPGIGGRGKNPDGSATGKHPVYRTDAITQPGAPDESSASVIGVGLVTAYSIDKENLMNVAKCLYSSTLLTAFANLFVNPMDAVISLNIFPCSPNVSGPTPIKLLNHTCVTGDLGVTATGSPLSSQFKTIDFGTVNVTENWGSFLDYDQTEIELYLPFIGSIQLDVSECMNGSINVQYTIDFITGMCVANVLCTKTFPLPSDREISTTSQHSYQGNCAIQVPLGAVNYSNLVGSLLGACTTGLTNPIGGGVKILNDAVSGGLAPAVTTKGSIVANAGYCSVLYPYIRIRRPITAEPESYQKTSGYPSYINTTLGECEDLCVCSDIDLHTIEGATDSELERIRQLCLAGVHV